MIEYIEEIKRQFIEVYGFARNKNGQPKDVPDGVYPMTINGKVDNVKIKNDMIHCCNFDEVTNANGGQPHQSSGITDHQSPSPSS